MCHKPVKDVIVLIPGIMGSILKRDDEILWGYSFSTLIKNLITGGGSLTNNLALYNDDSNQDNLGDGIIADSLMSDIHLIPGFWKIDGYSSTRTFIKSTFDVTLGQNYFEFPYDWRRNNIVAARKLDKSTRTWLDNWKNISGNKNARLILIAHSMGGLISRYFLECLGGWKITKALITFGTPYRGSLNALDTLSNGIRKGHGLLDLTKLIRQLTSVYQLLPTYPCYDPGDGKYIVVGKTTGIPNVDSQKATDALKFHETISISQKNNSNDAFYRDSDYSYLAYSAVGIKQETIQSAKLNKDNTVSFLTSIADETGNLVDMEGDGTVPRISAIPPEQSSFPHAIYVATQHGSLQIASAVLTHAEGIITGMGFKLPSLMTVDGIAQVALKVEDFFFKDEDIVISARPTKNRTLKAIISNSSDNNTYDMKKWSDGWHRLTINSLRADNYRVTIVGDNVESASDSFAVVDIEKKALS